MASTDPHAWPRPQVAGRCPMGCGEYLVLGAGGRIVCSWPHCLRSAAVDELLEDKETEHLVVFHERNFTVRHPLRERLDDQLLTCDVHAQCEIFDLADNPLGSYRFFEDGQSEFLAPLRRP